MYPRRTAIDGANALLDADRRGPGCAVLNDIEHLCPPGAMSPMDVTATPA